MHRVFPLNAPPNRSLDVRARASDLHSALSVKFWQAWWRFRPVSTPPFGTSTRN
ncbi:MAG: hypothetical protein M3R14_15050 [Acidobacteriota bacterium]|nr:hypothetical protein [Acidobacteriota bacterium]